MTTSHHPTCLNPDCRVMLRPGALVMPVRLYLVTDNGFFAPASGGPPMEAYGTCSRACALAVLERVWRAT